MAFAHLRVGCCLCVGSSVKDDYAWALSFKVETSTFRHAVSKVPVGVSCLRSDPVVVGSSSWRLNAATELRAVDKAHGPTVEIPVTCYQIIGVTDRAEKDEIVKSVMNLKSAEVEEGYTMDAVVSRQDLLMNVRDKLLFEPEYAGNMKEKIPPKSPLGIPWAWLPGALCLLQEVGEEQLVLDIGREGLRHSDSKPYVHDMLLAMALAECAIAKIGFEKNNVSQGFEALARAQCLLRSKISLGKMPLLSQIEESLEELAPACTLELLGMPHTPENAERRRGAIAALRELLRQGLDVETSCQVQDWPCFLGQALSKLMATEIVDLLQWDSVAVTRKNKKSLGSQNQRVVIDFNSFYMVLLAHIALGFSSKQTDLLNKAKTISECLVASEGIDLKFEEAFCSFLLGQGDESEAIEKLQQLESYSNPASCNSLSGKGIMDSDSGAKPSLELWLKDAVLWIFPDTRDCSPSLASFFGFQKKPIAYKPKKGSSQAIPSVGHRRLSSGLASDDRISEESPRRMTLSSRHLGQAAKQLAPADLQSPLISNPNNMASNMPSPQLQRNLTVHHYKVWESWFHPGPRDVLRRFTSLAVSGCILFATFKILSIQLGRMRIASRNDEKMSRSTPTSTIRIDHNIGVRRAGLEGRLKKLLSFFKLQPRRRSHSAKLQSSCLAASLSSSSMAEECKRRMPVEEAESLVRQWQATKAEALGPAHLVYSLSDVLDESMLLQWQTLAEAAKAKSCFWRFVLLHLSILRADVLLDSSGGEEMAEIEALLEEAAELVDDSLPKNPNYYSTYKILYILKRQDDGSWRFCEGNIQTSS